MSHPGVGGGAIAPSDRQGRVHVEAASAQTIEQDMKRGMRQMSVHFNATAHDRRSLLASQQSKSMCLMAEK